MTRKSTIATVSLIVTIAGVAYFAPTAAQSEQRLVAQHGKTLESRVPHNAGRVILQSPDDPPLEVAPPANVSLPEWLAQHSQVVALVDFETLKPELTAGHDWIRSQARGHVVDIYKDASNALHPGSQIALTLDGGELTINGTTVVAQKPWARQLTAGRYLLFANVDPTGQLVVGDSTLFEVSGGTVRRLARGDSPSQKAMEAAGEDSVIDQVRQAIQR